MTNNVPADHLNIPKESITTVIDKGVTFEGTIVAEDSSSILVKGEVIGSIQSNGAVIVSKDGVIRGSVNAKKISVLGRIEKKSGEESYIHAEEFLQIQETGRLTSTKVTYAELQLHFGAKISGELDPLPESEKKPASIPTPAAVVKPASAQATPQASVVQTPVSATMPMTAAPAFLRDASKQTSSPAAPGEDAGGLSDSGNIASFPATRQVA